MTPSDLLAILSEVERGAMSPEDAVVRLATLPFEDIGHARVDHHRSLRTGLPEVIYAAGKTAEQTVAIFSSMIADGVDVLATRVDGPTAEALLRAHPGAVHNSMGRTVRVRQTAVSGETVGHIAVVCAGTSDLPVAEEAATTAETFGARVTRLYDIGVA
jgi:NCAIR mutase (PurE)-related protein